MTESSSLSRCAGCGIISRTPHPFVGVMQNTDALNLGFGTPSEEISPRGFVSVPVCGVCHQHPERRVFTLKCAFFPVQDAKGAVAMAGINQILFT